MESLLHNLLVNYSISWVNYIMDELQYIPVEMQLTGNATGWSTVLQYTQHNSLKYRL